MIFRMKHTALRLISRFCDVMGINYALRPVLGGVGVILMFHRVCEDSRSRVNMGGVVTVSFLERLLRHIRALDIQIIKLSDIAAAMENGPKPFVCITFDDGYLDNKMLALPLLEAYDAPATIFVPTAVLDGSINAWWLQLEMIAESPAHYRQMASNVMHDPATLQQFEAYFKADQQSLNAQYFMSAADIKEMDAHPLIDIGGHTRTHPKLSSLSTEEAYAEIKGNKDDLETLLGRRVECFAYPYGNKGACGDREYALAEEAGYTVAVTTQERNVKAGGSLLSLPRYGVRGHLEDIALFNMMVSGVYGALK